MDCLQIREHERTEQGFSGVRHEGVALLTEESARIIIYFTWNTRRFNVGIDDAV